MKRIIAISIILGLVACQPKNEEGLEGKKNLLAEKKKELKQLESEISTLKKEIEVLDPPKEKKAIQVASTIVSPSDFIRYVEVQGRVEADEIVNVSSEIGGRIVKLYVKEGQYIRQGQLVATTDLSTLEKQIDEIKNQLSLATTVYERQKRLWDQNIGSEIQFLEAKTNKEGLEKSLATLQSQISKKNIYAPISGYVDREFMQAGETAQPGMPIIQLLDTNKIKVSADVQEHFLKSINRGDSVNVHFPALGIDIDETITQIGRTIDLNNRTFDIEIETSSLKGKLKPNLLAIVRFSDFKADDVLSIPLDVVQEEVSGKKFVYIAQPEDGKLIAKKSYVETGESNVGEVIILSGIKEGDQLITRGAKSISEGDRVSTNS